MPIFQVKEVYFVVVVIMVKAVTPIVSLGRDQSVLSFNVLIDKT